MERVRRQSNLHTRSPRVSVLTPVTTMNVVSGFPKD